MFPLSKRKISGFVFKQLYPKSFGSLSGHPHLGVDYSAKVGDKLYAPFDGTVTTLYGIEGGNTMWFYHKNQDLIIRFMHLSAFKVKPGTKVKEGDLIALTGNTGTATNAPHLHLDISKKKVDIYNINNFLDPEKFEWITKVSTTSTPKVNYTNNTANAKIELQSTTTQETITVPIVEQKTQPEAILEQSDHISQTGEKVSDHIGEPNEMVVDKQITGIGEIINLIKSIINYIKTWRH